MNKKTIIIIFILLFVLLSIVGGVAYASSTTTIYINGTYNYDEANNVIKYTNEERKKVGLPTLKADYDLTLLANERAKEIALYFSHTRPDGSEELYENANFYWGENVALNSSSEDVVDSWMASIGHKKNILDGKYKSIGVGSFTTEDGLTYWVQIFSSNNSKMSKMLSGKKKIKNSPVSIRMIWAKDIIFMDMKKSRDLYIGDEYSIKYIGLKNESGIGSTIYTPISKTMAKYTSSDPAIATIDNTGKIKALREGKTTIKASIGLLTAKTTIYVKRKEIKISNISLSEARIRMNVGDTKKLITKILPENTTQDKTPIYDITVKDIVSIDDEGNIKALKEGNTSIIVSVRGSNKKAICFIEVIDSNKKIPMVGISLSVNQNLYVGDTTTISYKKVPASATSEIEWMSLNPSIVSVDSNGNIKALKKGNAIIRAKADNVYEDIDIYVKEEKIEKPKEILINKVTLNCEEITLKIGEEFHFEYEIFPKNTTEKPYASWKGVYYEIAELDGNNTIHAKQAGEGEVRVVVGKNNISASCKVKVIATDEITSLDIVPEYGNTYVAKTNDVFGLDVIVTPNTAAIYDSIVWTTDNPDIAEVKGNGYLWTYKEGVVKVTATAPNGVSTTREITIIK